MILPAQLASSLSKVWRILIVEDESLVAADLEERLNGLGYEVCGIADNHDDAVSSAQTLKPDLVLMDIHLIGKKDGVDAATTIRRTVGSPVVFLTAHADDATLARISTAEPFGYTLKPFDERELKATIEVALFRYQAESRSKKMEKWLSTTLGCIGDGVIATDIDGKIKFINSMAERVSGWLRSAAIGQDVASVFVLDKDGEDVSINNLLADAARQGSVIYLGDDHFLKRRDGTRIPVGDSISVIRDDDDRVTGWVIIFRDLSAIVAAQNEQKKIEEKMKEAQRLESLGILTGGIAHDFNNILQIIVLNAALGKQIAGDFANEKTPTLMGLLGEINNASSHGANLCSQMLAYAGQGRFTVKILELSHFIDKAVALLRISLNKSTHLVVELAEDLPLIQADASQLHQIIMNLVINASDALDGQSGTITVETLYQHASREFLDECRTGSDLQEGHYVMLKVSDTGCGMTEETLARIFDPFFTTKFQGRGLGLAALLGIVRSHGAALHVRSIPLKGTCFQILFPGMSSPSMVESKIESPIDVSQTFSGRVLFVDDEPSLRIAGKTILSRFGFDVDIATNGQDALEKLATCSGKYRFVMMDLTMPQLSGNEAFKTMKVRYPSLPIIIMTGYSDESAKGLFIEQSPTAFMRKPFSMEDIARVVQDLVV